MSKRIFKEACRIAYESYSHITLGGGEPTLHPLFPEFFGIALLASAGSEAGVFVATNGTNPVLTNQLLELHRNTNAYASCRLSADSFHWDAVISPELLKLAINNSAISRSSSVCAVGRGKNISGAEKRCACADIFISPKGDIYPCGCKITKLGNIMDSRSKSLISDLLEHEFNDQCEQYGDIQPQHFMTA
jgi:MoaA/NifB/PqqE/SkfB family radical SAM enzyme